MEVFAITKIRQKEAMRSERIVCFSGALPAAAALADLQRGGNP